MKNPKSQKSFYHVFDFFFELWLIPIFKSHPELSIDKRFPLRDSLHSVHLRKHIERCWTNELLASIDSNRRPHFLYAAWRCYGPAYVIVSTCLLIIESLCVLQALLFYYYSFEPTLTINLLLWGVTLVYVISKHLWKASVTHMGIQLRVSLQTLLLKKVLLISTGHVHYKSLNVQVMEVVRRLSNLDNLFLFTPYIFVSALFAIAVAFVLGEYYRYSTTSLILVMGMLLVLIPYQVLSAYRSNGLSKKYLRQSLDLLTIFNEFRRGRDEVKAYRLDGAILDAIRNHRRSKRGTLLVSYVHECLLFLISLNYTKVVTMVFLMAHSWFQEYLPEEKVLLLVAFLEIFMYPLSVSLSRSITLTAEFLKTIDSLQEVLMMIDKASPNLDNVRRDTDILISMENVRIENSISDTLRCDQLEIVKGQTISFPCDISRQAKKTLLRLLTGEVDVTEGTANIYGKVSFCSEKPWLFPRASLKQNVLCNHFYSSQKYQRIVNILNLNHEFGYLPNGDNTIVGCKGDVNITRNLALKISIARVLYRDAEVFIFDGVLDLLNAKGSKKVLQQILSRGIQEQKCIIIFTKRPWLARETHRSFNVVYGQVKELDARKVRIESLSDFAEVDEEQPEEDVSEEHFKIEKFTPNFRDVRVAWKKMQSYPTPKSLSIKVMKGHMAKKRDKRQPDKLRVVKSLMYPFQQMGPAMVCTVLFGIIVTCFSMHTISAGWHYICLNQSILPPPIDDAVLQVLLCLCISASTLYLIQLYWLTNHFLNAVHDGMVSRLFSLKHYQKMEWESISHIMQCIQPKLDTDLSSTIVQCVKRWVIYVVAVTMMVVYNPLTLIQGVAMSLCLAYIVKYCAWYITKLWHLQDELWNIVEVYYKFKDEQIISIRSLGASEKYKAAFHEHMDNYTSIQYMAKSALEGLSFWMGLVSVMNIGLLILMDLFADNVNNKIALFFSMLLPNLFPFLVEHTIKLLYYAGHINTSLNHVRRTSTQTKKTDDNERSSERKPQRREGYIESKCVVCKVNTRIVYLNFSANLGELIGVLGDGNFSIASLLYGFCEILNGGVTIENGSSTLIDGYIPADPHIFSGPLNKALDFGKPVDHVTMWSAIQKVGLSQEVARLELGMVTNSDNWRCIFSHHQRQLLYLAGNIVKGSNVLVIRFDPVKCEMKQEIDVMRKARRHLPHSTIFILSNRLRTVLKTKKIMVFRGGALLEFSSTTELILESSSSLSQYINTVKQRSLRKELRDDVLNTSSILRRRTLSGDNSE